MTETTGNGESKIRKVLFNEIALIAGALGIAFGIFNSMQSPKTDLEVIKELNNIRDNHIHTIEVKLDAQDKKIQVIDNELVEIKTILNERLPKR